MWTNWPYNRKIKSSEMSKSSSPQALPRKFSFVFVVDNDQCPFDEFFFYYTKRVIFFYTSALIYSIHVHAYANLFHFIDILYRKNRWTQYEYRGGSRVLTCGNGGGRY